MRSDREAQGRTTGGAPFLGGVGSSWPWAVLACAALLVVHVEPTGPAEKGGVLLGDLVVELAGRAVEDTGEIQDALSSTKVGETVELTVLRAGSPLKLSIKLEDRPTK